MSLPSRLKKTQQNVEAIEARIREGAKSAMAQVKPDEPQNDPTPKVEPDPTATPPPPENDEIVKLRRQVGTAEGRLEAERKRWEAEKLATQTQQQELANKLKQYEEAEARRSFNQPIDLTRYFTAEQIAEEGEAKLRAMLAASEAAALRSSKPITDRLDMTEKSLQDQRKESFFAGLTAAVPNWREIDTDPDFEIWLAEMDDLTGKTRKQLGLEAVGSQNLSRSVAFYKRFNDHKESLKPTRRDPSNRVIPAGTSSSPALPANANSIVTRPEITAHFKNVQEAQKGRGPYAGKPQLQAEIEQRIQAAVQSNSVR